MPSFSKIPDRIIQAVQSVARMWKTEIHLQTESLSVTDLIGYLTGILQRDCLFVLCVNPLSHLLNDCPGYMIGKPGEHVTAKSHIYFLSTTWKPRMPRTNQKHWNSSRSSQLSPTILGWNLELTNAHTSTLRPMYISDRHHPHEWPRSERTWRRGLV